MVDADQAEDSDSVHRPLVLQPHGVRPHRIIRHFSSCNSQLANILHIAAPVSVFPGFMPDLSCLLQRMAEVARYAETCMITNGLAFEKVKKLAEAGRMVPANLINETNRGVFDRGRTAWR